MNKDIRIKWTDALRSGNFKQGTGALQTKEGGFCCLGVLCEVLGVPKSTRLNGNIAYGEGQQTYASFLPPVVAAQAELSTDDQHDLATMNDEGQTFEAIADHIDRNL